MARLRTEFDPYLNDPDHWGVSLAQMSELLLPCLKIVGARSVAEVGAFAGDLTRVLVDWAEGCGARVFAIDPAPQDALVQLADDALALELVRERSLEVLRTIPLPDVVIIDGDHNYWTVSEELRLIGERAPGPELPLVLFHDVCWPHGRRDDYFSPDQIPPGSRRPVVGDSGGLDPSDAGAVEGGLPYPRSAARAGGPRNGVLTAIEDFAGARAELRLVVVPAFFGFGALWHRDAPWSHELARLLDPWDRNPILERLEANRVHNLARWHRSQAEVWRLRDQLGRQQVVLRRLLESSAFAVAERLSRLRVRVGIAPAQSGISKDEVRKALDQP